MDAIAPPLPCQRHLFEVPDDISYLDAAAWSPLPRSVREAGEAGLLVKSRPWAHPREAVPAQIRLTQVEGPAVAVQGAGLLRRDLGEERADPRIARGLGPGVHRSGAPVEAMMQR